VDGAVIEGCGFVAKVSDLLQCKLRKRVEVCDCCGIPKAEPLPRLAEVTLPVAS
jgi:hypothetical protein